MEKALTFKRWILREQASRSKWRLRVVTCPFCGAAQNCTALVYHLQLHGVDLFCCPCGQSGNGGYLEAIRHLADCSDPVQHLKDAMVEKALREAV